MPWCSGPALSPEATAHPGIARAEEDNPTQRSCGVRYVGVPVPGVLIEVGADRIARGQLSRSCSFFLSIKRGFCRRYVEIYRIESWARRAHVVTQIRFHWFRHSASPSRILPVRVPTISSLRLARCSLSVQRLDSDSTVSGSYEAVRHRCQSHPAVLTPGRCLVAEGSAPPTNRSSRAAPHHRHQDPAQLSHAKVHGL